jgi:hypothetical protein
VLYRCGVKENGVAWFERDFPQIAAYTSEEDATAAARWAREREQQLSTTSRISMRPNVLT